VGTNGVPTLPRAAVITMRQPGIVPSPQGQYRLIDFGDGRRLERLGDWLLDRPAPQATSPRTQRHWRADWVYAAHRTAAGDWTAADGTDRPLPPPVDLQIAGQKMRIGLGNGGQIGLYPEHIACWSWLAERLANAPDGTPMLNLFAASGGASLAALRHGAAVTHVDAQNSALQLARVNLDSKPEQPGNARIIREDVGRFVARARRNQHHYPVIVLDPPSFGRGPKGRTWSLNRDLPDLIAALADLLGPEPVGLWLSTHTPGWDDRALSNLLHQHLPKARIRAFELGVATPDGRILPSGHAAVAQWQG